MATRTPAQVSESRSVSFAEATQFVEAMDRCWLERRFQDLHNFLAEDVVLVAPGGNPRIKGISAAVESYRQFMAHATVQQYATAGHEVTLRGDTAVIEYGWNMDWTAHGSSHQDSGREVLVLARRDSNWRVVWRTQILNST